MALVLAAACSHAPGITGRAGRAEPTVRDEFYRNLAGLRATLEAARPDALVVVAAEHFANFFYDKMPSFAVGMSDSYEGPIEDEEWLAIPRTRVPGNAALSRRLITSMMSTWPMPRSGSSTTASWCRCTSSRRASTCPSFR